LRDVAEGASVPVLRAVDQRSIRPADREPRRFRCEAIGDIVPLFHAVEARVRAQPCAAEEDAGTDVIETSPAPVARTGRPGVLLACEKIRRMRAPARD